MVVIEIGDKLDALLHYFMLIAYIMFGISRFRKRQYMELKIMFITDVLLYIICIILSTTFIITLMYLFVIFMKLIKGGKLDGNSSRDDESS